MRFLLSVLLALVPFSAMAGPTLEKAGLNDFAWKTGQVVVISEMIVDPTTFFFEAATGSRFGHTGVVVVKDKDVSIYEADPKLKGTGSESIESFIGRSIDGKDAYNYTILDPSLTPAQEKKLIQSLDKLTKKSIPYNFSQVYQPDGKSLNCSEFVFTAFGQAGIKNVGEIQTAAEALNLNPMNGGVVALANQFGGGRIPKPEDKVITPFSVARSRILKALKSTLPVCELSDAEIFAAWKNADGFLGMVTFMNSIFTGVDPLTAFKNAKADPKALQALQPQIDSIENTLTSGGPLSTKPLHGNPGECRKEFQTLFTK